MDCGGLVQDLVWPFSLLTAVSVFTKVLDAHSVRKLVCVCVLEKHKLSDTHTSSNSGAETNKRHPDPQSHTESQCGRAIPVITLMRRVLIAAGTWFGSGTCQTPLSSSSGFWTRGPARVSLLLLLLCTSPCRQIKGNCAESFTEYWTCLDYTNLAELRHCRKQQKAFDSCVLDKLGWERPDLGDLSKVSGDGGSLMGGAVVCCVVFSGLRRWHPAPVWLPE